MEDLVLLLSFFVFCVIQAMFINGVKSCFEKEMIFNKLGEWLKSRLGEWWYKPIAGCSRCMSSIWGAVTFWPVFLIRFGFEWWQVPLFVANVFILVYLVYFLYKRQ